METLWQDLLTDGCAIEDAHGRHEAPALRDGVRAGAAALRAAGLTAREPVLTPVSAEARDVAAILAVIAAGGVAVPLARRARAETLGDIAARTGARFLLDGASAADGAPLETLADAAPAPRPLLEQAAIITFTSGSTGQPKGVVLSGARMRAKIETIGQRLGFGTGQSSLNPLQLTFSFGQWVTFLTLLRGGTVHLRDGFDPAAIMADLGTGRIAYFAAVPTMLRMLPPDAPDPGVAILTGGEPVTQDLRQRFVARWPRSRIASIYGLTESGTSDLFQLDDASAEPVDTLGAPAPDVAIRTDAATGEILIRSPYGMLGYLDMPAETEATLAEGWLRTGDIGRIEADGTVTLVGRLKELINRGGNKISPLEVERLFADHPDVALALATGVADPRRGEAIHLLVVPRGGATPTEAALRDWAAPRTDRFRIPDRIHLAPALPIGRTGKADRALLRRQIEAGEFG